MAISIESQTSSFHIYGDGINNSVVLSVLEYPFINRQDKRPSSVAVVQDTFAIVSSTSLDSAKREVTINFNSAFSGEKSLQLALYYDC